MVYSALKAQASKEGKTLSGAVYALMHTANECSATKKHLLSLESQINELKSLLLANENSSANKIKNDGPGRIRTGDLRRVKTEDLGLSEGFPEDEITTRKASAPS
jgi:hypothetical protein